jgi:hypothetical protein
MTKCCGTKYKLIFVSAQPKLLVGQYRWHQCVSAVSFGIIYFFRKQFRKYTQLVRPYEDFCILNIFAICCAYVASLFIRRMRGYTNRPNSVNWVSD